MNLYILDADNQPVPAADIQTWGEWMSTHPRDVAVDFVGAARVSTVFLGLDHNLHGGSPILWETMIFGGEHDEFQHRYTTYAAAKEGHEIVVAMLQQGEGSE